MNIYAHTPPIPMPPYISVNSNGDLVDITVRGGLGHNGIQSTATMVLTRAQFADLIYKGAAYLRGLSPVRPPDVSHLHRPFA